jgi:hypothetical protein
LVQRSASQVQRHAEFGLVASACLQYGRWQSAKDRRLTRQQSGVRYRFLVVRPDVLRDLFLEDFRGGTFAPFSRASLSPIAIACLRLVTLRPELLFSVPFFLRRIVERTFFDADFPYFAIGTSLFVSANHVLTRCYALLNVS